jgi:peptidyl-tRNA hydrolase
MTREVLEKHRRLSRLAEVKLQEFAKQEALKMSVKQVIVVRNDLRSKLRHGKLAAQVAHASMGAVFNSSFIHEQSEIINWKCIDLNARPELENWFNQNFTKVVLRCDDEEQLLQIAEEAKEAGLMNCLIKDAGNTVFNEPTHTCVGIGPATAEELQAITGHLKMY